MSTTDSGLPSLIGGRYTLGDLIGRGGAADVFRAHDELLGREVAIKMFGAAGAAVPSTPPSTPPPVESDRSAPPVEAAATDLAAADADAAAEAAEAAADPAAPGPGQDAPPEAAPAAPAGPELVGDLEEGQEARHRREVLTLAGLSHPGLVTVYDVGDEDGRAYFVMQLIEGDTLAQRVRGGPLSVVDVVALGAALADALAYVHRRGVVHRDVKPGNVLLDGDGRAHLSDFGIAAVRDAAPVTAAGMVIGTASYLAPEQVRGEAITPAVDVYALGLVLIECLTGRREYPGNALEAAVARLHRRPVVPPRLPGGLAVLLAAMTADEPDARPTAEEVVLAMRGVSREVGMEAETVLSPVLMTGPTGVVGPYGPMAVGPAVFAAEPVTELAPTGASPAARPARRHHRAAAIGVALALTLLAAGSAVTYALISRRDPPPPPAPVPVASVPAIPTIPPVLATTTTTTEEAREATVTRNTRRPRTTAPTTTTAVVPPPAAAPPPVVVTTTPAAPPSPVVTTTPEETTTTSSPAGRAGTSTVT